MTVTRICPTCGYSNQYPNEGSANSYHHRHSCMKQLARAERARRRSYRAANGPKRDCQHPGHPHVHGDRVAYVRDRCRCDPCTASNTAASAHYTRHRTFGRWQPFVDAGPVRAHIQMLREHGIGTEQIAKLAAMSGSRIRQIARRGTDDRPGCNRVRPDTARRILAIEPATANRSPNCLVDGTGTRRRIQALVAIGWSPNQLAAQLHRSTQSLTSTLTSTTVTVRTAHAVGELYEQLWEAAPAQRTVRQHAAVDAAREDASEHGWLPPLAWDDIDRDRDPQVPEPLTDDIDEIAVERAIAGDGIRLDHLNAAEQAEVVRLLTERGKSIRDIAEQLATTKRTVSRRRAAATAA